MKLLLYDTMQGEICGHVVKCITGFSDVDLKQKSIVPNYSFNGVDTVNTVALPIEQMEQHVSHTSKKSCSFHIALRLYDNFYLDNHLY